MKINNLHKIVVGILFMVCLVYVVDNPTPKHVRTVPIIRLEEYKELQLVNYEINKRKEKVRMMGVDVNPATRKRNE